MSEEDVAFQTHNFWKSDIEVEDEYHPDETHNRMVSDRLTSSADSLSLLASNTFRELNIEVGDGYYPDEAHNKRVSDPLRRSKTTCSVKDDINPFTLCAYQSSMLDRKCFVAKGNVNRSRIGGLEEAPVRKKSRKEVKKKYLEPLQRSKTTCSVKDDINPFTLCAYQSSMLDRKCFVAKGNVNRSRIRGLEKAPVCRKSRKEVKKKYLEPLQRSKTTCSVKDDINLFPLRAHQSSMLDRKCFVAKGNVNRSRIGGLEEAPVCRKSRKEVKKKYLEPLNLTKLSEEDVAFQTHNFWKSDIEVEDEYHPDETHNRMVSDRLTSSANVLSLLVSNTFRELNIEVGDGYYPDEAHNKRVSDPLQCSKTTCSEKDDSNLFPLCAYQSSMLDRKCFVAKGNVNCSRIGGLEEEPVRRKSRKEVKKKYLEMDFIWRRKKKNSKLRQSVSSVDELTKLMSRDLVLEDRTK
ncbi:hypothetical protein TNCT_428271 [Trichonephila clavata]|uniref:Uncharacterized protein n=1 Tax=Trichonephila clavata TaxID=2740835 RepID=A0A8X6FE68_TRICU|nr:hypothetical protein TNCT_428271 [Trichonephila clavata]